MAATTTTTHSLSFTLNLARGGDTNKRTLSFDVADTIAAESLSAAATSWLAGYDKLIQPNSWRDSDTAEEEWTTIGITPTFTTKTVTAYDPVEASQEGNG